MKEKELTLKEAEQIVDTMYQNKFINSGTIEDNNIHLGNMDNIEFTDLENASIYLLREEIKLKQELQRKDNVINELKQNKRDYERENILEMKLHILDDNWNELKKWLDIKEEKETVGTFSDVLDKIKELESK